MLTLFSTDKNELTNPANDTMGFDIGQNRKDYIEIFLESSKSMKETEKKEKKILVYAVYGLLFNACNRIPIP